MTFTLAKRQKQGFFCASKPPHWLWKRVSVIFNRCRRFSSVNAAEAWKLFTHQHLVARLRTTAVISSFSHAQFFTCVGKTFLTETGVLHRTIDWREYIVLIRVMHRGNTSHVLDDYYRNMVAVCPDVGEVMALPIVVKLQLKCDGIRWHTGGEVKGKLATGVGSQYTSYYLGTWCIQRYYHYYRWCAHLGCQ